MEGGNIGTITKRRPKFIRKVICQVCGDDANDHEHYGGIACYACKAFFRRAITSKRNLKNCKNSNHCIIDKDSRNSCKACRLSKCLEIGMKSDWVMTEKDKAELEEMRRLKKGLENHEAHVVVDTLDEEAPEPIFHFTEYEAKVRRERTKFQNAYGGHAIQFQGLDGFHRDETQDFQLQDADHSTEVESVQDVLPDISEENLDVENILNGPKPNVEMNFEAPVTSPVMGITLEEGLFLNSLVSLKRDSFNSVTLPQNFVENWMRYPNVGNEFEMMTTQMKYLMERQLKFCLNLQDFQRLTQETKNEIFSKNVKKMRGLDYIYSMSGNTAQIQLSRILNTNVNSPTMEKFKFTLDHWVKSPWLVDEETEKQHLLLLHELHHSVLDEESWLLLIMMIMFDEQDLSTESALATELLRGQYERLLYRYLVGYLGPDVANLKMHQMMSNINRIRTVEYNMEHLRFQF